MEWRTVTRDPRYEVSDSGLVRSRDRVVGPLGHRQHRKARLLKTWTSGTGGYARVDLGKVQVSVHYLVLEAFVAPRPEGMEALHLDSNPANPALLNLRWGTHSENMRQRSSDGHDPNAAKVRCKRGHDFTEANTRNHRGRRICRLCENLRARAYALGISVAELDAHIGAERGQPW